MANNTLSNGYQTVDAVFSQETTFFIPRFQRGYRWTEDNVTKLIEDIFEWKWVDDEFEKTVFNSKVDDNRKTIFNANNIAISPYCIQPLAICEDIVKNGDGEEHVFSVIDGQQRLTTLLIVISALKSFSEQKEWPRITIQYESRESSADYLEQIYNNRMQDIEDNKEKCLDFQYMYHSFSVARALFQSKLGYICDNDCRENYISYLKDIILYATRFIWYKFDIKESNPHVIFENFNSGKTSLTDSELIKAIFMDGENYGSEDIDDKRIVISEKWDEIENELHDEDFWTFIPHAGQYNSDSKLYDTRIDLIFEYLVLRKWDEIRLEKENKDYVKAKKATSEDHYLYELVNRWISKEIAKETSENISKAQVMGKCWAEVRNIYLELRELYKEDTISGNENQIYNMVGLYIKLKNIRTSTLDQGVDRDGNIDDDVQEAIAFEIYKILIDEVIDKPRSERINSLKELVYGELGYASLGIINKPVNREQEIEYAIKNINYEYDEGANSNCPAIKTLIAYNIALINQASGLGERFNFRALAKQTWQKEHIFACAMKEKGDAYSLERRKGALELLAKEDNDYVNYIKFITGNKTKNDVSNLDDDKDKYKFLSYQNESGEEVILDETNEESVKDFLTSVSLHFTGRDERDTDSARCRMAKALKLRNLAKEMLVKVNLVIGLIEVAALDSSDDSNKMRLYLALKDAPDSLDKNSWFNHSELQKRLKEEIKKCVNEQDSVITVELDGIKTTYQRNSDQDKDMLGNIESNWFSNYKEFIYRKFYVRDETTEKYSLKAFADIKPDDWDKMKDILVTMKEAMQEEINVFFNEVISKYLKDNSLGNMALLTAGTKKTIVNQASVSKTDREGNQNSKVSCEPFYEKKSEIVNYSKEGKFVPIGTLMVFSGAFDEISGPSYYWLHNCRIKYMQNMIDTMKKFLI